MNPQVSAITSVLSPSTPDTSGTSQDPIMQQLGAQNGVISSSDQSQQAQYAAVQQQLQKAGDAEQVGINAQYAPKIANQQISNESRTEVGLENNHGYGLNMSLLTSINKQNDDDMQSLVQERDNALAAGQAATAKNIADSMQKAIDAHQANVQKVFENMLSIASYGDTAKKNAADEAAQQFTQQSDIMKMAAQYGISIDPGETLQSLANKIAPVATKEENAKLDLQTAQIHEANANAYKAIADANAASAKASTQDIASIAQGVVSAGGPDTAGGQAFMANLKSSTDQAKVRIAAVTLMSQNMAQQSLTMGVPLPDALKQVQALVKTATNPNGTLSSADAANYSQSLINAYKNAPQDLINPPAPVSQPGGMFRAPGTFGPGGLAAEPAPQPASLKALSILSAMMKGTALGH